MLECTAYSKNELCFFFFKKKENFVQLYVYMYFLGHSITCIFYYGHGQKWSQCSSHVKEWKLG